MQDVIDMQLPPFCALDIHNSICYNAHMKGRYKDLQPRALAYYLGVNVSTIARWRKQGCPYKEAAPYGIGKTASRPRYSLQDVLLWLRDKQAAHNEEAGTRAASDN